MGLNLTQATYAFTRLAATTTSWGSVPHSEFVSYWLRHGFGNAHPSVPPVATVYVCLYFGMTNTALSRLGTMAATAPVHIATAACGGL